MSELNQSKISRNLIDQKIFWKLNPPSSPWMSGSCKSIVKITKRGFQNTARDRPMSYEALVFFSRNRSYIEQSSAAQISNDITYWLQTILFREAPFTFRSKNNEKLSRDKQNTWKLLQAPTKMFWRCFIREYRSSLQIRRIEESST